MYENLKYTYFSSIMLQTNKSNNNYSSYYIIPVFQSDNFNCRTIKIGYRWKFFQYFIKVLKTRVSDTVRVAVRKLGVAMKNFSISVRR